MLTHAHDNQCLHIKEAAAELDVHPSTIRRAIHSGELDAVRLGPNGGFRVPCEALEEFVTPYVRRTR
jgi:excisionase family DNA binding protein